MDEYGTYLSLRGIQMDKEVSLAAIRELYKKEWESEEDIPYAQSIYKMIDEVIEYQDHMRNIFHLEGIGPHKGEYEIAYLPFLNSQAIMTYQHNTHTKIAYPITTFKDSHEYALS